MSTALVRRKSTIRYDVLLAQVNFRPKTPHDMPNWITDVVPHRSFDTAEEAIAKSAEINDMLLKAPGNELWTFVRASIGGKIRG